jgi:hypothetical protein
MNYKRLPIFLTLFMFLNFSLNIRVKANTDTISDIEIKTFTYQDNTVGIGDLVTFNTELAHNNITNCQYTYIIHSDKTSDIIHSDEGMLTYVPRSGGEYKLIVLVQYEANNHYYDGRAEINFTVIDTLKEDINLDGIVDIYDIVAVSRNIGLEKTTAHQWYDRWNQDDSDDIIDMKDVARVAQTYNQVKEATNPVKPNPVTGENIISFASNFLGVPYQWGGIDPSTGFDASGFVMYVYGHFNIPLPRTVYLQINCGRSVGREDLLPGDLVFFGTSTNPNHVGIYAGDNVYIHAPRTGEVVSFSLMTRTDYLEGRRIID